ncbi:hypothetical protein CMV_020412 [Castanea mollissima]|uniref:Uncharacterized protein n=1 Tax=Castanea mollissima TaxID=60419 RepID=A0A8J4QYM0_9ROSI|nr:hypothetical protein CMV_020412 [Castanea mollissima]
MVTLIAGILIKVVQDYPDLVSPQSLNICTLHSSPTVCVSKAIASSIVTESFYWTTFILLEAFSLLYVPRLLACLTYRAG